MNIDHVATVRNARGGQLPDPLRAARLAEAAGADGITAHLREDRRHIVDDDIAGLMRELKLPLNLEMAATQEMLEIALRHRPHAACIVPEKREERTTEGGLDAAGQHNHLKPMVARLREAGIRVSLFIDADPRQLEAAVALGAPVVELHTGAYCELEGEAQRAELARLRRRGALRQARPRMPRRSWAELRQCRTHRRHPRSARTQHRPFPDRRGDLRRPGARDPRDAPPHGRRAQRRSWCVILGIGNDLIDIRRIEKSLERFGDRFVQRIFTETEQKRSEGRATRAASYAKRFAAKEACSKALGTGLRRGVFWRDMGVVNLRSGKPTMALTGGALARLHEITPAGMSPQIDLTLTDEYPMAQAIVIISPCRVRAETRDGGPRILRAPMPRRAGAALSALL